MSRPFSYNDDNFTVIGNICFGHILTKPVLANEKICEIPTEIGLRLIQKSAHGDLQNVTFSSRGYDFYGKIIEENNRYYLATNVDIPLSCYAMFFLFLKDI